MKVENNDSKLTQRKAVDNEHSVQADEAAGFTNMVGRAHDKSLWLQKKQDPASGTFNRSTKPEPHVARRKEILAKHPEIKKLFRTDIWSAVFCLFQVIFQIWMSYQCQFLSWPVVAVLTYVISGVMNQSLQLAMHELSHDLWFKKRRFNQYFAWFANLPTGTPSSATFRRHHLEHHTYQGVDDIDQDVPTEWETYLLRHTIGKLFFLMFTPIFYSVRPMFCRPKTPNFDEIVNFFTQLAFNVAVCKYFGVKSFFYLIFGSFWGMGIHPMTAHFISEHFVFVPNQETYSYYGCMNYLVYNVGFHNEHHDFPRIPGRLLPQVTALAPEYYLSIPSYTSWCRVLWDFITHDNMTLWARVKRTEDVMFNTVGKKFT